MVESTKINLKNKDVRALKNAKELYLCNPVAITEIDLSFNKIDSLQGLEAFQNCSHLILDNNTLGSLKTLPFMPGLTVLSLSNNQLRDVDNTLGQIDNACPNIQHLNLIGNAMNPMLTSAAKYPVFRAKCKIWLLSLETLDGTDFV